MTGTEASAMSAQKAIQIVWRRALLVAVCACVVGGAALASSLLQDPRYEATASLLFRDPGLDQKLFGSSYLPPSKDPNREAATNVRLVGLDAVSERTAARLADIRPGEVKRSVNVKA